MNQINLRQIAIALAIAPLLFILFIKAQAPDPIKHHRILTDLHKIESMNAEVDILTLKFRYRLQSNYDGLVSAINEIGLRQSELRTGEHAIFNKGNEKINRAMEELDQLTSRIESGQLPLEHHHFLYLLTVGKRIKNSHKTPRARDCATDRL